MRRLIKSILLIFVLVGCTPTSLIIDSSNVDYGTYPENYKEIAGQYLNKYFTGSVAFAYEAQKPFKAYSREAPIFGGKVDTYGYLMYVNVIAVYTYYYRSYTTRELFMLLIRNGKVVTRINPNKYHFGETWYSYKNSPLGGMVYAADLKSVALGFPVRVREGVPIF